MSDVLNEQELMESIDDDLEFLEETIEIFDEDGPPLIEDIAHNAFQAAFKDPRFPPLTAEIHAGLKIEISVLSPIEPLPFADEAALLGALTPGQDGLVLVEGERRGLFLPQVWEGLPEPADFLAQLKQKAELPPGPLGPDVTAGRFTVVSFAN